MINHDTISNMSKFDLILSYPYFLKDKIRGVLMHCRAYRNYPTVLLHILRRKYPIKATLRNDRQVILRDHNGINNLSAYATQCKGVIHFDTVHDTVTISSLSYVEKKNLVVTLYSALHNGDIFAIFLKNEYGVIPVKGNVVIDIGANIGDSPIYFALRGAGKVIGIEPIIKNYELARKNVELNNLSNKVTLILAGCSGSIGYADLQCDKNGTGVCVRPLRNQPYISKQEAQIPLITFDMILNEINLSSSRDIVLKMDCEGCEYDTILSSTKDTLRKFRYILVEYHFGYKNLKEKLEKCGFIVSVKRPVLAPYSDKEWHYMNLLYAQRK
jgi:FkbM family methyltransferase